MFWCSQGPDEALDEWRRLHKAFYDDVPGESVSDMMKRKEALRLQIRAAWEAAKNHPNAVWNKNYYRDGKFVRQESRMLKDW